MNRNAVWLLVVTVASIICWNAAQSAGPTDEEAELYRLFVDAMENIDRNYVEKIDRRELMESAIRGMVADLDPYSNYLGPTDWKQFNKQTQGKFGGVGIQISVKDGILTVISPLVGTPAYEAGILAGDQIIAVGPDADHMKDIRGIPLDEVVEQLTGDPGTKVILKVKRTDKKPFDVSLVRAKISVESILGDTHGKNDAWDYMIDKKDKIGYIRINAFIQDTPKDLEKAIKLLQDQGMKGLIIDLRYNPGGLLSAAVQVCDMFINDGKIVSTKGRNTTTTPYTASNDGTLPDFPMVILVNHYSASASEIMSACLQDHKRAIIIGERTWGKGSVQNMIPLEDGNSGLKLTTASYWRPSGKNIHRFKNSKPEDEWGVSPDKGFEVKFDDKQHSRYMRWRQKRDLVLGKKKPGAKIENEPKKEPKEKKPADDKKPGDKKDPSDNEDDKEIDEDDLKDFKDLQIEKALETIRAELKKPAEKKSA